MAFWENQWQQLKMLAEDESSMKIDSPIGSDKLRIAAEPAAPGKRADRRCQAVRGELPDVKRQTLGFRCMNHIPSIIAQNVWSQDDPAIRQLYLGGRRIGFQSGRRIELKKEEVKQIKTSTVLPPISRKTSNARRESLAFLNSKSIKSKEKSMLRFPQLSATTDPQRLTKRPVRSWKSQPEQRSMSPKVKATIGDLELFIASLVSQSLAERTSLAISQESEEGLPLAPPLTAPQTPPMTKPQTPPIAVPQTQMQTLVRSVTEMVVKELSSMDQENLNDPRTVIDLVKNRLNQEDINQLIRRTGLRVASEAADLSGRYQPAIEAYEAALRMPMFSSASGSRESSLGADASLVFGDGERRATEAEFRVTGSKGSVVSEVVALTEAQGQYFRYSTERRDLMGGGLTKIPETQKRTVRLYICSSYSDMKDERCWLMRFASARLQHIARQYNLDFQMVDLKWGVPDDLANDPQNLPVYLEQIRYCRQQSVGPVFTVLIGDRYGNQELPTTVPVDLFQLMLRVLGNLKISNGDILKDWYQLDENATPPVYRLEPIAARIHNFGLMEYGAYNEQIRKTAARQWLTVEQAIRDTMEKILLVGQDEGTVSSEVADQFALSVVEKEIRDGMLSRQTRYCVWYERRIDSIEYSVNEEMAPRYVDIIVRNEQRSIDRVKQGRLEALKVSMGTARRNFVCNQVRQYEAELWENPNEVEVKPDSQFKKKVTQAVDEEDQMDQEYMLFEDPTYLQHFNIDWDETLEGGVQTAEEKAFMTAENEVYLYKVVRDFVQDAKDMIAHFLSDRTRTAIFVDRLGEEVIEHARICIDYASRCSDTRYDLAKVEATVRSCVEAGRTLVVRGEPGSGVTTYVAQIASRLKNWFGPGTAVVMRFLGSTPGSMSITKVLITIYSQVAELFGLPRPQELSHEADLKTYFKKMLEAAARHVTATDRMFIILDGIEKLLTDSGEAHSLGWIPLSFPPFIHLILSASTKNQLVSRNLQILFRESAIHVKQDPLSRDDALEIVRSQLMRSGRTLKLLQLDEVIRKIEGCPLPLYACLLAKEAALWQSSYAVTSADLPPTVDRAVWKLLAGLEVQLGPVFVRNALCYLTVSEGGLSEIEWEDALACDDEVLEEVFQFTDPASSAIRCPQLLIARLRFRLGELLIQVDDYGIPVFYWHDSSVGDAVIKRYLRDGEQNNEVFHYCNRVLSDLFYQNGSIEKTLNLRKRQIVLEHANRMVAHRLLIPQNRRKLQKLPRFLYQSGPEAIVRDELKNKVLCNVPWLMTKLRGRPFSEVLSDFDMIRDKDEDLLLIERVLTDAAYFISEQPEMLQVEIAGRFSVARHLTSDCIRRMVLDSKMLLVTASRIILFPVYPGLPQGDRSLKMARQGPTHLLGVHALKYGIVWGKMNGLEILELTPVMRSLYRIGASVELENIRLSPDKLHVFYVQRSVLFKWCVTTGELLGQCSLVYALPQNLADLAERRTGEVFQPMAVSSDCTRIIIKINFRELMIENCALIVMDAVELNVVGLTGEGLTSEEITHVEVFKDHLYVTITTARTSPDAMPSSQLFYFKRTTNRTPSGFMRIPPRVSHIPGCFRILEGNSVYIACLSSDNLDRRKSRDTDVLSQTEPSKRVVALHVTDIGLLIVLFAAETAGGRASLVIHGVDGSLRGRSTSKESNPTCLSMAKDNATAFVGYDSGVIEAYHVPSAVLGHAFSAHRGSVNCIEETDPLMIYTTGADEYLRLFDLTVTPLAMDFTRSEPSGPESGDGLSDEDSFMRRATEVAYVDLGVADSEVSRMVIGYSRTHPIVATHDDRFNATQLQIPKDVDGILKAWLMQDDGVVMGIGLLSEYRSTAGRMHRMVAWNRLTGEADVIEGFPVTYADLCAVTTDRRAYLLLRRRKQGCTVVAYDASTGWRLKKYRSHDDASDPGDDLLTSDDLEFGILVQPSKRRLVVWRLAEHSAGPGGEDIEVDVPSEMDACDDEQFRNDSADLYVEGQKMEASILAAAELFVKDQSRSKFLLRFSFLTSKAIALSGSLLAAGTEKGALVCLDLNQFNEYAKAPKQKRWQWNDFLQVVDDLHSQPINTICVAPDNRYVITGSNDALVRVYDTLDRDIQSTLRGHTKPVLCVAVSSWSQFVVSGSSDCTIRLWNAFTGRPLTTFSAYQDVYDIHLFRQVDDELKVVAMVNDQNGQRRLMLLKALNLVTTNKRENF